MFPGGAMLAWSRHSYRPSPPVGYSADGPATLTHTAGFAGGLAGLAIEGDRAPALDAGAHRSADVVG
jgi:hypothetical protein